LGWGGGLGFAKLVAKLFRVRLSLEPFDSGESGFVRWLVAKDCRFVAIGHEGGFENAVGDGVGDCECVQYVHGVWVGLGEIEEGTGKGDHVLWVRGEG
jgi:hypothetical protein